MSSAKVYLDSNATTPLAPEVLDCIHGTLRDAWGNPSSSHSAGLLAKSVINKARNQVAEMIGAHSEDIIFTSGGTEANNMAILSVIADFNEKMASKTRQQQQTQEQAVVVLPPTLLPHIITSNIEHDSIRLILDELLQTGKITLTVLPVNQYGVVPVTSVVSALTPLTVLVTVMLANNETGTIQPVREISQAVQYFNETSRRRTTTPPVFVHTDAAQAIGKIRVNVEELGVDFLTIVGHKFYGPRIGALYAKSPGVVTPVHPIFYGGGQERNYRPGTENTGMIAGLGMACALVTSNLASYESHMRQIRDYLEAKLEETFTKQRLHFNGRFDTVPRLPNTCNVSFLGYGLQGSLVLSTCSKFHASVGAACHSEELSKPSPILLALGIKPDIAINALRLSVGRTTSKEDIDIVVDDLYQTVMNLANANGVAH